MSIRDDDGNPVPVGETGEVWLRRGVGEPPSYHYLGAEAESAEDQWETVGDIGRVDEDGYLYLTDRRSDMLLVGGVNVYPAEVEAVSDMHPAVLASCCVGIPDEDLGSVPALIIETADGEVPGDFDGFLTEHLAKVKRPRHIVGTRDSCATRRARSASARSRGSSWNRQPRADSLERTTAPPDRTG